MGLGAAGLVSLAEAREQALANRKLARSGGDPLSENRRAAGVPTFAEAAGRVLEQKRGGWRGRWHAQNWWRSMERYVFPRIGSRPVSEVNTADVLEILTPIWHVKAETARAVRQRVRSVLEWAIALDMRGDNPCDRVMPVLGAQSDIVTHRQALPTGRWPGPSRRCGRRGSGSRPSSWRLSFSCSPRRGQPRCGWRPGTRSTWPTACGRSRPCG